MSIKHLLTFGKKEYLDLKINSLSFANADGVPLSISKKKEYVTTVVMGGNVIPVTLRAHRLGNIVQLSLSAFSIATVATTHATITQTLDPDFTPIANSEFMIPIITNGVLPSGTMVVRSDGVLQLFQDAVHTPFTGVGNLIALNEVYVSYPIN